ncbi:hypothetical protein BJV78DRAFT_1279894 [Lactifluus subvellereus]|nr:hypothetical protein BJV78DRAFT_1279894 [Lactifluus subvellereus]
MASNTRPPSKTPSYLQPTASTAQRAASSAQSKRTRPTTKPTALQSRAPLVCKTTSGTSLPSQGEPNPSASKSQEVEARARTAPTVHSLPAEDRITPTEPPHDTLQVAAQVQSWLFMQSNLQRCLSIVQKGAQDSHSALAEATSNDTTLGSSTTRWNAENLVVFLDDLAKAGPSAHLDLFIHRFLEHEKSWYKLQSELTQFVARLSQAPTDSPLEEGQNLKGK